MTNAGQETAGEKPLNRGEKAMLILGAGAVMFLFYVFALAAIVLLLALLGVEFCILLVLLRFGLPRLMVPVLNAHGGLLVIFIKSFRLRKGVDFRIPLQREDAPELFRLLNELCRRLSLELPQDVSLLLDDNAWVQLKGMRSGAGRTVLGIGYDLLAGLSATEVEAVLAHEMVHAKLVQRGFKNWLGAEQARVRLIAMGLWGVVGAERRARKRSVVSPCLFAIADWLVRLCARLVAAYSRQDEFEADRGAAELCGTAPIKSALGKLESLHQVVSRLPWNERVAHLQDKDGYSRWLLQEIARAKDLPADNSQDMFNKYATHPLIRDRLAALPEVAAAVPAADQPGIGLLARPDEIAVKLVTELQRLQAEQEKKDSKALEKWSRKTRQQANLRPWQGFGVFLIIIAVIAALVGCFSGAGALIILPICALVIAGGVVAYRLGRYRDRVELPVPDYATLRDSHRKKKPADIKQVEKDLEAEMTARFQNEKKRRKAALFAAESYAALATCDYLRAHVAARQCLKHDNKSIEGALALAVAGGAHGQGEQTGRLVLFVQKQTALQTFSTAWGPAWALLLAGDFVRAEALTEKALGFRPNQPTLLLLLAVAQSRRGKLQTAIANARQACKITQGHKDSTKVLITLLLDGGYVHEARENLERLQADIDADPDMMRAMVQLSLLRQDIPAAEQWTGRLKQAGISKHHLVRLGQLFETARQTESAAQLYQQALADDHFPEAHLGLGRLESLQRNKQQARQHLLAALNVERPTGTEGAGALAVLHPILNQLVWLEEPVTSCRAWVAQLPGDIQPPALAGQSFMVYAPDLPGAQNHFQTVLNALQPGKPPVTLSGKVWREAPRQMQPDGPVRPGVQGIWQ